MSDINAEYAAARRSVKVLMTKTLRRCHGVSNVRVPDAAWVYVLERRSVKAHAAGARRA